MRNRYISAVRVTSLLILGAVFGIGIVDIAFGHWKPGAFELGVGGAFFILFSLQWLRLNDLARRRGES